MSSYIHWPSQTSQPSTSAWGCQIWDGLRPILIFGRSQHKPNIFIFRVHNYVHEMWRWSGIRLSESFILYILSMKAEVYYPYKLCLIEGGRSWHPFINLLNMLKTHFCVRRPKWNFWCSVWHELTPTNIKFAKYVLRQARGGLSHRQTLTKNPLNSWSQKLIASFSLRHNGTIDLEALLHSADGNLIGNTQGINK